MKITIENLIYKDVYDMYLNSDKCQDVHITCFVIWN